eukprot:TRINITY_DN10294_c0_g1_i2.p1 TRINITY_DN10294_c0_g1~~TRINITY_DN10294_c0_g1_i2.p1  ORF type:complete len:161 (-),score=19.10 TRINITY_DN10294_c0_g1_i2:118-600(-)
MVTQFPLSCFKTQAANRVPVHTSSVVHRVTCTLCTHPWPASVGATPAETAKPPTDHTTQNGQAWPSRNVSQERNKQDSEADRVADDPADWHNREVASKQAAAQENALPVKTLVFQIRLPQPHLPQPHRTQRTSRPDAPVIAQCPAPVSYTHLTLPTKRIV